jgi:hypothetical protein
MQREKIVQGEVRVSTEVEKRERAYHQPEVHDLGSLEKVRGLFHYGPVDWNNRLGWYPFLGSAV